ncbi:MAG: S8 family serine peptidase [Myxococcota bacterium]|nr:S8 family serine peptidase [Myxococcota bacterium]
MAYRYRVAGRVVELDVDEDLVAVRYEEPARHSTRAAVAAATSCGPFEERVEIPKEKYTVLPVAQTPEPRERRAAAVFERLESSRDVARVAPVFRVGETRIVATDRLMVGLAEGADAGRVLEARGCEVLEARDGEYVVRLEEHRDPFEAAAELDALPEVAYAEPDFVSFRPQLERGRSTGPSPLSGDPREGEQYAPVITRATEAWTLQTGDPSVTIAILDEGVETGHPDLAAVIVGAYDGVDDDTFQEPNDWDAHGTACAGLAAAVHGNDVGMKGIGGGCTLHAVRIAFSSSPRARWTSANSWIARAIDWSWQNGADILSNSWGGGAPSTAITNAFERARTQGRGGKGAVVIVAAGNDSGPVSFPGDLPNVLTVSASNEFDEFKTTTSRDGETWWGSNFGPEIDVAAPGVHNLTTDISAGRGYDPGDYTPGFNGTSSATPIVAGAAGLLLSANPELTEAEVRELIRQGADKVGAAPYTNGRNDQMGFGRLNVLAALQLAFPQQPTYTAIHRTVQTVPVRDKRTSVIQVAVGDTRPIREIKVDVDIRHTYVGDLVVKLQPPAGLGGDEVVLHRKDEGGSQDDLVQIFTRDEIPELADLEGKSLPGSWTLEVTDVYDQDQGEIRSFGLELRF